jgi:acylphosphatase
MIGKISRHASEDNMEQKCVHVIVTGRVQGVFFRAYTKEEADKLGLVGWVRNRPDGSVEALVAGESDAVDRMIAWFPNGSPMSSVTKVTVTEEESTEALRDFAIRY